MTEGKAPSKGAPGGRWRACRKVFRAVRITILLLVLVVIVIGAYLNEVGLPDFVKRPLLQKLHAQGVDIQFTRLRLRWYRGVVAENVSFGSAVSDESRPHFFVKEAELRLSHAALARLQFNVDAILLHDGQLTWVLTDSNQPFEQIAVTNIQAQLRFLTNDQWSLDHLTAGLAGANLKAFASVTNASAIRDWPFFQAPQGAPPGEGRKRLRQLAETIHQIKFERPPEIDIRTHGDGHDPRSFDALLTARAPAADTPWGTLSNGFLVVRLAPANAETNQQQIELTLRSASTTTSWAGGRNLDLAVHGILDDKDTNLLHCHLNLGVDQPATQWASASRIQVESDWTHSIFEALPRSGMTTIVLSNLHTRWGSAGGLRLETRLQPALASNALTADPGWGWWAALEPYPMDWNCVLRDIRTEDPEGGVFELNELATAGTWRAPNVELTNLQAALYRGHVDVRAALNVATRVATFAGVTDFDAQKTAPFLNQFGKDWLAQYSWDVPPFARGQGGTTLPVWTNQPPDWLGEVLNALWLRGDVQAGSAAYRGVPFTSTRLDFELTNRVWHVRNLLAIRPEGRIELTHDSDDVSKRYYFHVYSTIDVKSLRGLLDTNAQEAMDLMGFSEPPVVDTEIWGHWKDRNQLGVRGHVVVTNFTVRGESFSQFQSDLNYSNLQVVLTGGRLDRGAGHMTADGVGIDFAAKKVFLTNGYSDMEPMPPLRAVGRKVAHTMEPYRFANPPVVHAQGALPMTEDTDADAHFLVDGGPFNWGDFNLDHISGGVDWVGNHLRLTNVSAAFYQGALTGKAAFDFGPDENADFTFHLAVTNAALQKLMADLHPGTNHLEGTLSGELDITRGNTGNLRGWFGFGQAGLRDGLLWEIPIFGILSPVLDDISKGLGESKADEGSAKFIITNSVIRTDNLEIRAPAVRMLYRGTVDFDGRVNAVVEAQLLKGLPGVGPIVSALFWPVSKVFECNVTGTLEDPKKEFRMPITRLLLVPFSPLRTLKEVLPGDKSSGTNAPSGKFP